MRAAIIAHTVYCSMASGKSKKLKVEDFMPQFQKPPAEPQSPQEMMQRIRAAVGDKPFTKTAAS